MTKSRRLLQARRQFVHLYFTRSALLWGVLPDRITDSRSTKAVKTFIRTHNKALSVVAMCVTIARLLLLVGA
jgi:hypothetical protein